jgi:hypothetical protein
MFISLKKIKENDAGIACKINYMEIGKNPQILKHQYVHLSIEENKH